MLDLQKDMEKNMVPVFFILSQQFETLNYKIEKTDYRWHVDSMRDKLILWVEQKNGLNTSKCPIEIEYSFLMDGGFLTEGGLYLKTLGVAFERWIPHIKALKNKL
jgi:hypothetical protein